MILDLVYSMEILVYEPFYDFLSKQINLNLFLNTFNSYSGTIILIDEIHTPDSSRYFYMEGYQDRQDADDSQKQLSKEFVRQWLITNGFQGLEGQSIPDMDEEFIASVSERYIELYEQITGDDFVKADVSDVLNRVEKNINAYLA